jgi:hypothetical protein
MMRVALPIPFSIIVEPFLLSRMLLCDTLASSTFLYFSLRSFNME